MLSTIATGSYNKMEIQHQNEEDNVVNNIEHRYQARLVILDDLMDAILTAIYDIYNFLALEKWEKIFLKIWTLLSQS